MVLLYVTFTDTIIPTVTFIVFLIVTCSGGYIRKTGCIELYDGTIVQGKSRLVVVYI